MRLFLSGDYEFLCRMYGLSGASGMELHPVVVIIFEKCFIHRTT